jgi:hypothetical protein
VRVGRGEQPLQARIGRGGVVMEEPDPLRGLYVERLVGIRLQDAGRKAGIDRRTESSCGIAAIEDDHAVVAEGFGEDAGTRIGGSGIDTDDRIGMSCLSA